MSGCNACGQRDCRGGCYAPRASKSEWITNEDVDGWLSDRGLVAVPVEPSGMLIVDMECARQDHEGSGLANQMRESYKAMIKAAGEGV